MAGLLATLFALGACRSPQVGADLSQPWSPATEEQGQDAGAKPDAKVETGLSCAELTCDENAGCNDRGGTAKCSCLDGFEGDGFSCSDVDECESAADNDCGPSTICLNRPGTFSCRCAVGFEGDAAACTDVDECQGAANTCHPDASCGNTEGGFGCSCEPGFSGDGFGCTDIDECDPSAPAFNCGANAHCINTRGAHDCACNASFGGDPKAGCQDLCTLAQADATRCNADGHGLCEVGPGDSATCTRCAPPYVGDGLDCTMQTWCADLGCGANTQCIDDGDENHRCACAPGFQAGPDQDLALGGDCADSDECAADPPVCDGQSSTCINAVGGFVCECKQGFARSSGLCVNVDECAGGPLAGSGCDPNADCLDRNPGYECSCRQGYEGDGKVCRDIDECKSSSNPCGDDASQRCTNTAGSYLCECNAGYTRDGSGACVDLDECSDDALNDCDKNATCVNKNPEEDPVGFECQCTDGWAGDGTVCRDVDQCANSTLNDCGANAICIDLPEGYSCSCGDVLTGDPRSECYCDLSGFWGLRQDVRAMWEEVATGGITAILAGSDVATRWELHRYRYDGDQVVVEKKECGWDRAPDLYGDPLIFDEVYNGIVPLSAYDATSLVAGASFAQPAAVPGSHFTTPDDALLIGIALDDPLGPFPASRDNVGEGPDQTNGARWVDVEDDGVPGVTVWPSPTSAETHASTADAARTYDYLPVRLGTTPAGGIEVIERMACLSTALRMINHLEGKLESCTRIVGDVVSKYTDARVQGCMMVPAVNPPAVTEWNSWVPNCEPAAWSTLSPCEPGDVDLLDGQEQTQWNPGTFEMIKLGELGDAIDCETVRTVLPPFPRP
ncbi:MAG: hypothetical protein OEZ06_09450 [Myxococcales bacterium]|nr:hypothetical protein [Myxococcales bacterium]